MSLPPPPSAALSSTADLTQGEGGKDEPAAEDAEPQTDMQSIPEPRTTSSRETTNDNGIQRTSKILNFLHFVVGLFKLRFPIQQAPINFFRPQDHTSIGTKGSLDESVEHEVDPEILEVKVNFREELFERYREVIEERLQAKYMNSQSRLEKISLDQFPGWTIVVLFRLRSLFHIFDSGGDGLVDFSEFCETLVEYGDETPEEERRRHFDEADTDSTGAIDFEQFLTMMYTLTMKERATTIAHPPPDPRMDSNGKAGKKASEAARNPTAGEQSRTDELTLTSLGSSLRQIDGNMSRIQSLDVVQQLQAGLF